MKKKNRRYWKKQCDNLWSHLVRLVGHCEICGRPGKLTKDGRPIKGLNSHHLLSKGAYPQFRHDIYNGICLCVRCHIWGSVIDGVRIAAHGDLEQQQNFWKWMKKNKSETYEWYERNKNNKKHISIDYEEKYKELSEMITPE